LLIGLALDAMSIRIDSLETLVDPRVERLRRSQA
jgi:hypothetical protein